MQRARAAAPVKIALSPGKFSHHASAPALSRADTRPIKAAPQSAAHQSPVAPFAGSEQDFEASFLS